MSFDTVTAARWREAIEQAPVAVFELDLDGFILSANPAMARLLDYPAGYLEGTTFVSHVSPDEPPSIRTRIDGAAESDGSANPVLRHLVTAAGDDRWVHGSGIRVEGVDGSADNVLCFAVDFTADHLNRQRLDEANARFAALVEHSTDAIFVLEGAAGHVSYASPGLTAVTGLALAAVIGSEFQGLVHPEDLAEANATVADLIAEPGKSARIDCRVRHVDGGWRHIEATSTNLMDDPAVRGIVCNMRDVTDRVEAADRLARQARRDVVNQLERIKSDLVSRVGHEFRTPLTVILGYGQLLAHREMSADESCRAAEAIVGSGQRLERIVKLMEFSASADAGQLTEESSTLDLGALIDDAVDSWAPTLDETHVIVVDANEGSVEVMADREWLTIAVNELIDNAVKFSPEGGTVTIATRPCELAGVPAVEIALIDQGVGMSVGAHAIAFEQFIQVDASDTRRFGGLGLGLALVRGFALAHSGTVSCASVAGGGARVAIVIPTVPV